MNIVRFTAVGSTHFNVQSHVVEFDYSTKLFFFLLSRPVFIIVKQLLLVVEFDLEQGEAHRISTFLNILLQILYIS